MNNRVTREIEAENLLGREKVMKSQDGNDIKKQFIQSMINATLEDPERVLTEIVDYIVENKKYQLYKTTEDLLPFFQSMQLLNTKIISKTANLETSLRLQKDANLGTSTQLLESQSKLSNTTQRLTELETYLAKLENDNKQLNLKSQDMRAKLLQYERGL